MKIPEGAFSDWKAIAGAGNAILLQDNKGNYLVPYCPVHNQVLLPIFNHDEMRRKTKKWWQIWI